MLGHVSEILAGGSRGYKPWCLDRRQRVGLRYPGAIFLDFVWSKLVCPPPERGKNALGCRSSGHGDFTPPAASMHSPLDLSNWEIR